MNTTGGRTSYGDNSNRRATPNTRDFRPHIGAAFGVSQSAESVAEDAVDRAPDTRFPSRSTNDVDARVQLPRLELLTASPTNIGSYYSRVARPKTTSTTTASSSPRLAYAYAGPLEPWAVRIVRDEKNRKMRTKRIKGGEY